MRRFRVGLMTEHLDGSYPTSKFREKYKPWVMDIQMLMPVILSIDIYHNGRERLFIIRLGSRKPRSDNGDKRAFFFSICSAGIHS